MPAPPILALDETDSTNAEARRRAEAGETGPLWITAKRQTAGRGRRGRAWETGKGNLAATLLLTTDRPPAEAAQVSFVAALATGDMARIYMAADLIKLKWPNDMMLGGRKAAGILVESGRWDDGRLWLAVGIGVNLASAPQNVERPATSFADHALTSPSSAHPREGGDPGFLSSLGASGEKHKNAWVPAFAGMSGGERRFAPDPMDALNQLAEAFDYWLARWETGGFPVIADAWTARAYGLGQPCAAHLGSETVHGIAEGLDSDGALRLRLADGAIRRISAGDVFFEGV